MIFFFVSFLSFLLLPKPPLLKLLPSWVSEMRLLMVLLCQEAMCHSFQYGLMNSKMLMTKILKIPFAIYSGSRIEENVDQEELTMTVLELVDQEELTMTVLELPELALDLILAKLPPSSLCSMSSVCTSLRHRCVSDHLWERHMKEKWGRVIGKAAEKEWESYMGGSRKMSRSTNGDSRSLLPVDESVVARYLTLESGRFWFPAQVYNRENGNPGFMLSCYDAELSYDSKRDTFNARYPPQGHGVGNVEEGVKWERLRPPPTDTSALDLHVSDCLHDLRPGNHIEIQWRKNKGFPYGWWYGVVGHSESCDRNEHRCLCFNSDSVTLEFNQYSTNSTWRQTTVNRKNYVEEGNETNGFYGGIRKLYDKDEISTWRQLWPTEVLE